MSFFSKVVNKTNEKRQVNNEKRRVQIEKGTRMAFDKITEGMKDLIMGNANDGRQTAIVYKWTFVKDKDDTECIGVSKFNGIWINDMIMKGNLLQMLSDSINDEGKTDFRFFTKRYNNETRIMVSWKPEEEVREKKSEVNIDNERKVKSKKSEKPKSEKSKKTL